jgi:hypothetical protein
MALDNPLPTHTSAPTLDPPPRGLGNQSRGRRVLINVLRRLVMGVVILAYLLIFLGNCQRRTRTPIEVAVGTVESIRAAIASYAADSVGNTFPADADISDYAALVTLVNHQGATMTTNDKAQGFNLRRYTSIDADRDGIYEDYTMSFRVHGIADGAPGSVVVVSPSGIEKGTLRP